jgi:hypothetical protein
MAAKDVTVNVHHIQQTTRSSYRLGPVAGAGCITAATAWLVLGWPRRTRHAGVS